MLDRIIYYRTYVFIDNIRLTVCCVGSKEFQDLLIFVKNEKLNIADGGISSAIFVDAMSVIEFYEKIKELFVSHTVQKPSHH